MKSILFAILASVALVACAKKEEAPAPAESVAAPTAPAATEAPASEPAKSEEAKK